MARPFLLSPRNIGPLALTMAAVAMAAGFAPGRADAAASGAFLPHQALYELSLLKSRGSNAINSARGRILYNFFRQRLRRLHLGIQAGVRARQRRGQG